VIVLDTNVLSALMRPDPDEVVREWLDAQRADDVYTTAITVFELLAGIETLPASRKRTTLEKAFAATMVELEHRALPFDARAAAAAARLVAYRRQKGHPVELRDTQIAGIIVANNARFATFNVRHFEDLKIELIVPRP
jgi:predicted nucleic acid-binding protein